jgi:hypothetical protein
MKSYTVEYSESINHHLAFKYTFYPVMFILSFMLLFILVNHLYFYKDTMLLFVSIFIFVCSLYFLINVLSNYLNNKKYVIQYRIVVNGNIINVVDKNSNILLNFSFQDIIQIVSITFGITIFGATQLDIKGGKRIVLSNATNNYDLFLTDLSEKTHLAKKHRFRPTGSWIENIY